jgi:putative membrane protein
MLGLYLASVLVPGVQIVGLGTFILAAILLGFVNGFVRPVAFLLTLPITIVTLGLFLLVLNAAMFGLVGAMLSGFSIAGLGSAILGALIVSITSGLASWYIGPNGQIEVIVIRRD